MYSHIFVGASDLDKAKTFYDATFGALGVGPGHVAGERIFWMTPAGNFGVTKPIDGKAPSAANGGTIGFACTSAEQVDAWHEAGVKAGGVSIEDPPGLRPQMNLYLAYLRDPDGNKLCALYRAG